MTGWADKKIFTVQAGAKDNKFLRVPRDVIATEMSIGLAEGDVPPCFARVGVDIEGTEGIEGLAARNCYIKSTDAQLQEAFQILVPGNNPEGSVIITGYVRNNDSSARKFIIRAGGHTVK